MNKTININLGGIFFHIDEVAYEKLKRYLEAIRRSLSDDSNGTDEIISDIESRIGELLSEKVKDIRQVINETDIDDVITIMGKPEDYMVDDEIFNDDNYKSNYSKRSKKLYRDGDDKFLGGVSSGMAHYIGVDVIWIRLAWLIAAFGFGFGFIVYPILWILLPVAISTAEKLEMEGEAVNISNIEKKIKDEITEASVRVKKGIDGVADKVKNVDYKNYKSKARSGSQELVETIGKIFTTLFMVIGKFIGVLLIMIAVSTILSLLIGLLTFGSFGLFYEDWFYQNILVYNNSGLPIWSISALLFILIGIPFFFLLTLGLRILSNNTKSIGKIAKLSLLGFWLVSLMVTIFFGTRQYMQSAHDGTVIENYEITIIKNDTLDLKLIDNNKISDHSILKRRTGYTSVVGDDNEEKNYSNNIRLNILSSETNKINLKVRKKSQGRSNSEARENATQIEYEFTTLDRDLHLNGYFLTNIKNKFRNQKVYIDVYIPENQIIYLDKSTSSFLYDVSNTQNIYDGDMAKHYYRMTDEGLTCLDCDTLNIRNNQNSDSFKMKINKDGVKIEINDSEEKAEVRIDENGIKIISSKDSI